MSKQNSNPKGSLWHRWDPHIHAPGTLLSDQFGGDWEAFLRRIEGSTPKVNALGVTDYFCIRTYQGVREYQRMGRLNEVELLFPNVEMRLDIKTSKVRPINIHLLFAPVDPHHEDEIIRILGQLEFEFQGRQYRCNIRELAQLGKAFDPKQADGEPALRTGASQFKVTLQALKNLFRREEWLRTNCLVAVAGSSNDGTSGLQEDDSFAATRREIERFADIVFASTPRQREFWLGKLPAADTRTIEQQYRSLKPCLHGSDAHREDTIVQPSNDRYCWLKGDLSFETLRQAVIEPDTRVWIGSAPPSGALPSSTIELAVPSGAPWLNLPDAQLQFNSGLVAVIGARGSGKTALVDLIAAGTNSLESPPSHSSFLKRALSPIDHLGEAAVSITWGSGDAGQHGLADAIQAPDPFEESQVCYLSQQFVERLCSSSGLATDLRREMERVVFESADPTDRFEAEDFETLAGVLLEPIRARRSELREGISKIASRIVEEDLLRDRMPALEKEAAALFSKIATSKKDLASLLPKEKQKHALVLVNIDQAIASAQQKIEALRRRRKLFEDLSTDVEQARTVREPERFRNMTARFRDCSLASADWDAFKMEFAGDVKSILQRGLISLDRLIAQAGEGDPQIPIDPVRTPFDQWPLSQLRKKREEVKKEVGADEDRQKKYDSLQKAISKDEGSLSKLRQQIDHGKGTTERRRALLQDRRSLYVDVFRTFTQEEEVLRELYTPLASSLSGSSGALSKLTFSVRRSVDLPAWVGNGESLIDLRRDSRFRQGGLSRIVSLQLLPAWLNGSAEQVGAAMDAFREASRDDLVGSKPASVGPEESRDWTQRIADWLFDTSHISVEYGIEYDGVDVEQLSPGTRGIVLLLLYLAVDRQDRRPLLIDQPEENLDPHSVFTELVPHFREARKRRQVIIVTHNANLVVNTDADQVIVAESKQTGTGGLPTISYRSGGLENSEIRADVCRLLEGGERAFLERERRYRLRWGEMAPESGMEVAVVPKVQNAGGA